jgi:hypothetical protein
LLSFPDPLPLQDAPLDSDRESDAARLDDAEATGDGISDQDFTRGKRFRKLHKILVSTAVSASDLPEWRSAKPVAQHIADPEERHAVHEETLVVECHVNQSLVPVRFFTLHLQVQRPLVRLRYTAMSIAGALATIHMGMFVMIYMNLNTQMQLVGNAVPPASNTFPLEQPVAT